MHVAIIPDGNRRYAKSHNLSLVQGYEKGKETALTTIQYLFSHTSTTHVTLWVLSKANTHRPKEELTPIIEILLQLTNTSSLNYNIRIIGDTSPFPELLTLKERLPLDHPKTLILAINYCGRNDILRAVKQHGTNFAKHLDTADIPDPDLIIRTGREKRLSNFMNYQSGNSVLFFSDLFWPEFTISELKKALKYHSKYKLKRKSGI